MKIEPLGLAHCDIIATLHHEAFDEDWSAQAFADLISMPASFGHLALKDEIPVGFILCQGTDDEAEIITIATSVHHRRQGIAQQLVTQAFQDISRMFLEVAEDNPNAIAFYEKEGFEQVGKRRNYYKRTDGNRVDALVYQKEKERAS